MPYRTDRVEHETHISGAPEDAVRSARGRRIVAWFSGVLLVVGAGLLASAPSAGASEKVGMDKLVDKGYSCTRAGIFGWKCTMEGQIPYLCNNAKWCIPDPTVVTLEP